MRFVSETFRASRLFCSLSLSVVSGTMNFPVLKCSTMSACRLLVVAHGLGQLVYGCSRVPVLMRIISPSVSISLRHDSARSSCSHASNSMATPPASVMA